MKQLPIGIQSFSELIGRNSVYVDKTEHIFKLLNGGKYYFLSRPRRFGKSLLISTLKELFLGTKDLFHGLWIEDKWDWSQKYPIIHLPFSSMGYGALGLENAIINRLYELAESYGVKLKQKSMDTLFRELILTLEAKHGKVVILVDEYDKPIIDYIANELELAQKNQKVMKTFYSVLKDSDSAIRFLFITGVSRFAKVSIFSDLNNLNDITLKKQYNTLVGYTEEEIKLNFDDRIHLLMEDEELDYEQTLEKMRLWYNGYNWLGKATLYNPFGVLNLFDGLSFANYWFETGTPSFLIDLLKEKVLYDVDNVEVGATIFESFQVEKEFDLISLLFQTGYLTIKAVNKETNIYTLGYPNREVKTACTQHLLGAFSGKYSSLTAPIVVKIKRAFDVNDITEVIRLTNVMLKDIPYHIHPNTEAFYHAVVHLTYLYLGVFIHSEVNMSDARADAIVQTGSHIYCMEFKYNQTAELAMEQIKSKNYLQKYSDTKKELIGIGVNFSSETKNINDWLMEKL